MPMYTVIQIPAFADWLSAIKDRSVQVRLMKRLRKAQLGNLGDVKQVGNGVWEMREFLAQVGVCITCSEGSCLLLCWAVVINQPC